MRILHTSDWHMNDHLGSQDRSEDICRALERIAGYLEEHRVDVMLVTGDLFERSGPEKKEIAVSQFKRIFLPFLERNGTIIAISGNHDDEVFFGTLREALDLVAHGRKGTNGTHPTGRLYIAPNPGKLQLADAGGNVVQFVLMPYPTARCYLPGLKQFHNTEEKNRLIQGQFKKTLDHLKGQLDTRYPSVLLSHVHIRGVKTHPLYRLTEMDDVIFEPEHAPTYFAYAAFGHIHKAQEALPGAAHMRYAGSVERMDANESNDEKSVVLVEVGPGGKRGKPELLPLEATPIYHVEITEPEVQLSRLAEQYPDAERALVKFTLHWQPGKHNPDSLCREIRSIFKRCYGHSTIKVGEVDGDAAFTLRRMQDVRGTVRSYLDAQLAKHPHHDNLKAVAEELLAEEGII